MKNELMKLDIQLFSDDEFESEIGFTNSQYYHDIAEAIRNKTNNPEATFTPSLMAAAISGISTGSGVIVYPTEPTSGEAVWFQCGTNLLNCKVFENAYITNEGVYTKSTKTVMFGYIYVKPSTTYTLSTDGSMNTLTIVEYDEDKDYIKRTQVSSQSTSTVTVGATTKYIRVVVDRDNTDITTLVEVEALEAQFEQNTSASTYEEYITKRIYVLNDNEVYELFFDENDLGDLSSLQHIYSGNTTPTSDLGKDGDIYILI